MKNSVYLKDYVRMHPDNRMAWYLLGKEYDRSGQEGKAHYCYIQAGEIYEAFESSKVPAEVWKEYEAKLLEAQVRKQRNRRRVRKLLLACIFLLLIWIPSPSLNENSKNNRDNVRTAGMDAVGEQEIYFTAKPLVTAKDKLQTKAQLLSATDGTPDATTAVLAMGRADKWLVWKPEMKVNFTIDNRKAEGKKTLQSYDAADCVCRPPDAEDLKRKALKWTQEQEMLVMLMSAIQHYQEQKGKLPGKLSDLALPFPNNWIAGEAVETSIAFPKALHRVKELQNKAANSPQNAEELKNNSSANKKTAPFFQKELEIKVDKAKHKLALVSGNVILRVYDVGLGGQRTPEGSFRITDKVVNPNGHDDGEFGSRGMELSAGNYAIHGTNEEDSIGKDESLGCIRMRKADVEELFDLAPKGTKVTIGSDLVPDSAKPGAAPRFRLPDRQDQTNPHKTYHWLN
ncbi:hypothetical protein DCC85_08010 [Paenibacillus sp. CAA11]|uniref:L,D-transpeptidase n=1 Tax=Paenibacillus sp. CAA11 TaxID=1532905 RepID=UPI000D344261|nr:L,D-transpeptidase [Paenibacillus sp. CAA11]AWB44171.1 hypothetical protein DCC85_08010 [Paenibacillus sp. CAA11]